MVPTSYSLQCAAIFTYPSGPDLHFPRPPPLFRRAAMCVTNTLSQICGHKNVMCLSILFAPIRQTFPPLPPTFFRWTCSLRVSDERPGTPTPFGFFQATPATFPLFACLMYGFGFQFSFTGSVAGASRQSSPLKAKFCRAPVPCRLFTHPFKYTSGTFLLRFLPNLIGTTALTRSCLRCSSPLVACCLHCLPSPFAPPLLEEIPGVCVLFR